MRWELCFQQLLELGASNHVASSSSFVCQPRVSPHAALSSALIPSFASLRTALSCSGASPELHTQAPPPRTVLDLRPCARPQAPTTPSAGLSSIPAHRPRASPPSFVRALALAAAPQHVRPRVSCWGQLRSMARGSMAGKGLRPFGPFYKMFQHFYGLNKK
jgi:hypothetical protein